MRIIDRLFSDFIDGKVGMDPQLIFKKLNKIKENLQNFSSFPQQLSSSLFKKPEIKLKVFHFFLVLMLSIF